MNEIEIKINFTKGTLATKGIALITGDYASTKIKFEFDREDGTKVFEMKSPSDELVYAGEIINGEVLLASKVDVTTIHDNKTYTKYTKNDAIYWYQPTDNKLFTDEWVEIPTFNLEEYTKVQVNASLFSESGKYIFEVSLYEGNTKLTSTKGTLQVKQEQVVIDGEVVEPYLPVFDELMQDVQEGLTDIETAITQAGNLDISGTKSGKIATITITKQDGTTETVQLEDGKSIEYNWSGTQLGIRQEGESTYQYVDLKGERGEAGAIKFLIVAELPLTGVDDTIYLLPLENPTETGNNYAEYIYVNNAWELLGKIGVQVDLTDYVKNTDYATSSKGGTIKTGYGNATTNWGALYCLLYTYAQYSSLDNNSFISKGTLENVIIGKDLTTKSYVDSLVGDIASVIDSINGEVI